MIEKRLFVYGATRGSSVRSFCYEVNFIWSFAEGIEFAAPIKSHLLPWTGLSFKGGA